MAAARNYAAADVHETARDALRAAIARTRGVTYVGSKVVALGLLVVLSGFVSACAESTPVGDALERSSRAKKRGRSPARG